MDTASTSANLMNHRPGNPTPPPGLLAPLSMILALLLAGPTAAQAKPVNGKSYENWTVRCEMPKGSKQEQCFIFQNLVLKKGGQRVLHVAIGYIKGRPDPVALITMPLGISLPPGGSIVIDDGDPIRFQIERCEPAGCRAGMTLKDKLLTAFKKGIKATVTFMDASRRPINVPLSLKGFTAGLKALKP